MTTMPANQQPSGSSIPKGGATKSSTLVRSKSLRLAPTKPKPESAPSTLSRHGSIRMQKPTVTNSRPPFTFSKKPPLKPKPSFLTSKSSEHLDKVKDGDNKKVNTMSMSMRHVDGNHTESHRTPSGSPTSLYSEKSHSQDNNSWCSMDLVSHLKRLTEEHEKLQVEHARLRTHMLDATPIRLEQQNLSQSDPQPSFSPENSPGSILQNYRAEVLKLQEDNRKLQRKYWEQVLHSDLIDDEMSVGASQQIVTLIDTLDAREKELLATTNKMQELESQLSTLNLDFRRCQDSLREQKKLLEESTSHRNELRKQLLECRSALADAKESVDFLQIERSTLAETFQENEQSLSASKAEILKQHCKIEEYMECSRKLYTKVKDKNLVIQQLRTKLDQAQGTYRDMMLSQGAELTNISLNLSQLSKSANSILSSASDFAANDLSLQKEMLEEIMADMDSGSERSESPPSPLKSSSHIPSVDSTNSVEKFSGSPNSIPDGSAGDFAPNYLQNLDSCDADKPMSLVQCMVRAYEKSNAYEKSAKTDPANDLKRTPSKTEYDLPRKLSDNTDSSSPRKLSACDNTDSSSSSRENSVSSCSSNTAFRPVGMATPFRPVKQRGPDAEEEAEEGERSRKGTEEQFRQVEVLLRKVGRVIELMQGKFVQEMKDAAEMRSNLQKELRLQKDKQFQIQADLNNANYLADQANNKSLEMSLQLKKMESDSRQEIEKLNHKNSLLQDEIKCLEAVNKEQSSQIHNDLQKMMEGINNPNSEFLTNALAICDKLNLKQEIAKLKTIISQKEKTVEQLAQKFTRTTTSLERNLSAAEKEITLLDNVIEKAHKILINNKQAVESQEFLKELLLLVNGNIELKEQNSGKSSS